MQNPVKVGGANTAEQGRVVSPAEIVDLVKKEAGEKGIIIDLHLPDKDRETLKRAFEWWCGAETKADDVHKETKKRHEWKATAQGEGKLIVTGVVNAFLLLQMLINEIQRAVQLMRLREVVDFRRQPHFKTKVYLFNATWTPRYTDEKDEATAKVNLRELWTRIPNEIWVALDRVYKLQVIDNPDSVVVRLMPQQPTSASP